MRCRNTLAFLVMSVLWLSPGVPGVGTAAAQNLGTSFTFQGQLKVGGEPANGAYDMTFTLFDAPVGGAAVGIPVALNGIDVSEGLFSVDLDFGPAPNIFNGDARWVEIAVEGVILSPRQALRPTPYALALPGVRTIQHATSPNVIGGYRGNEVAPNIWGTTISGGGREESGWNNSVLQIFATVGGGADNSAGGIYSTVGGGLSNTAGGGGGAYSTVAGGNGNFAQVHYSTVGGGVNNLAGGLYSTVPGGLLNKATGDFSFAAGRRATADEPGCFVWADNQNIEFQSSGSNQFLIRASGGVAINTTNPLGFSLAVFGTAAKSGGGSWSVFSDARLKRDVTPIGPGMLDRILALKGYEFEFTEDAVEKRFALPGRQMGLIAQEVQSVFPEWVDTDPEGYLYVTERNLAAIMAEALRELRAEKDAEIEALEQRIARLETILMQNLEGGR